MAVKVKALSVLNTSLDNGLHNSSPHNKELMNYLPG